MTFRTAAPRFAKPRRLRGVRTLMVGCGDVGLRLLRLRKTWKADILATCRRPEQASEIRRAGGRPLMGDLADRGFLRRLARLTQTGGARGGLIWLAPPPGVGVKDPFSIRMALQMAHARQALRANGVSIADDCVVYVSTTGVYGDRAGQWTDETTPANPRNARAVRRVHAENAWRARSGPGTILRAPGIYAEQRLPTDRLLAGTPALQASDDAWSNHIHADDLARLAWRARFRQQGVRVINAVDDQPMRMGDYFDAVADATGLPRAPRLPRDEVRAQVSPMMWSFMSESRRLRNERVRELKIALRYPTVNSLLEQLVKPAEAEKKS